ncbi:MULTISPECIES: DUF4335 domain-containing protein [Fischerella]|uniref:DUF4335 domain-containing protein n=1 Tax=Fischerella TaxID=1190 RepID=UPI0003106A56|nr:MULTISPECIES: DUF4335 domain-containing protein [Fischerella]MBD2430432.1 DUF4335 domain-containing protein [Fischerella sp. FACHB-380]
MPVTNSVIRRYTPPTCTLEVLAQSSSLSRWVGKGRSVLKDLRFELSFDDPRLSEEQKIVIRGDRDQLEALCAAVTNYVQEFLQMSPESFWANFSELEDSTKAPDEPESQEPLQYSASTETLNSFNNQIPETEIHIKPNSHLTHNLFLGSLGYQASKPVVQLSLLQLFDLATALDQYSEDILALPNLYQGRSRFAIPGWVPAVAVLVLAVGLVPFTYQYAIQSKQKPTATEDKLALEPSPLDSPTPAITPTDQLPPLPFGSNSLSIPGSTLASPTPTSPQAQGFPTAPTLPNAPSQAVPPSASTSTFPPPSQSSSGNKVFSVPPTAKLPTTTAPRTLTNPGQQILIQPKSPQQNTTASRSNSGVVAQNGNISLNSPNSSTTETSLPSTLPGIPPTIATAPNNRNSTLNQQNQLPTNNSVDAEDTSQLIERLRKDNNSNQVATRNSNPLFDATAQVSEAGKVLTRRWQPPSGLNQTLEYSLVVGVDGTIERILPLGKASRIYIDRTGMPLIGERFVSPNRNGQTVIIRAVYSPDGKVKTFAEKD